MTNFLVLNSLLFFQKQGERIEQHQQIHLFLDRDSAGIKFTPAALQWSKKYRDQSHTYKKYKDLNEYLIRQQGPLHKQSHRTGRHFLNFSRQLCFSFVETAGSSHANAFERED
ncbi:MAG: toprim domain-containing protein [Ginsengibacter sp.]